MPLPVVLLQLSAVLSSSSWVIGEYCNIQVGAILFFFSPRGVPPAPCPCCHSNRSVLTPPPGVIQEVYEEALDALLRPRFSVLKPQHQAAYIHTIMKVFAKGAAHFDRNSIYQQQEEVVRERVKYFTTSVHPEVQERACFFMVRPPGTPIQHTGLMELYELVC